jgi:hypothetical protein
MGPSQHRMALAITLAPALLAFFPFVALARGSSRSSGYAPRSFPSGGSHRSTVSRRSWDTI